MKLYHDKIIKFETRGDDIEMLNDAIILAHGNDMLQGYLCYIKNTIIEQLDVQGIEFPKEEYPLDSPKGYSIEEFINTIK